MQKPSGPILLPDAPAGQDDFGPHKRIASALAGLIRDDPAGKCVALKGTWGSGKSTVVGLLKEDLERRGAIKLFVYDSWAHQGDPLRRSFLEEFYNFLEASQWDECKSCKKRIKALRHSVTKTHSETSPRLTLAGKFFAVSLPFTLAANSLLSHCGFKNACGTILGYELRGWLIGLATLLPLLILLIAWIYRRIRSASKSDGLIPLLIQKVSDETITTMTKDPAPTSVQFRGLFLQLVEAVLREPNRKLVITLDNLDRVSGTDALEIIATMRTFVDPDVRRGHEFLSRLWTIVPFDDEALQTLWQDTPAIEQRASDETSHLSRYPKHDFATAFMDKTFQGVFNIAPPMLKSWRDFFKTKMKEAFVGEEQVTENDIHAVCNLFGIKGIPQDRPLTPRDIILFINRLVVLFRQFHYQAAEASIPFHYLAVYLVYASEIKNPAIDLTNEEFLKPAVRHWLENYDVGRDWPVYLAALHFNCDLETARHNILIQPVLDALRQGNAQFLEQRVGIFGIVEVCEELANRFHAWKDDPSLLCNAAVVLARLPPPDRLSIRSVWDSLCSAAEKVSSWRGLDETQGASLIQMLKYMQHYQAEKSERFRERILHALSASFLPVPQSGDVNAYLQAVILGTSKVLQHIIATNTNKGFIQEHFNIPPVGFARVLFAVSNLRLPEELYSCFRATDAGLNPEFVRQTIVKEMLALFVEGKALDSVVDPVSILVHQYPKLPWDPQVNGLERFIQQSSAAIQAPMILGAIQALLSLSFCAKDEAGRKELVQLWRLGRIAVAIDSLKKSEPVKSMCFFIFCLFFIGDRMERSGSKHTDRVDHVLNTGYREIARNPRKDIVQYLARMVRMYGQEARLEPIANEGTVSADFINYIRQELGLLGEL